MTSRLHPHLSTWVSLLPFISLCMGISFLYHSHRSIFTSPVFISSSYFSCNPRVIRIVATTIRKLLAFLVIFIFTLVLASRDPRVTVERLVLIGEIEAIAAVPVGPPLRQSTSASGKLGLDRRILLDPVGQRVLAVLNDRLGSFVSIIRVLLARDV